MIDDLFLLHEVVFPEYLNIKEKLVYAFYAIILLFIFVKTIKVIKTTEFVILLSAIGFFALSIVSDIGDHSYAISRLEDVFKIVGVATWFTYFIRLCMREVNSIVRLSSAN
ncbi:hypothetical protein I8751_02800 [Nostocaceae cyanobacterium CENA357]|uniref:Uncharacterized protein n=1 Tax=Atlanticothrix silvestris CENA357 TaxID=1725252 RepID=A0A8J7HFG8_9CYAN|nr:hypothetical protein [Atlanticothrix silvestris]MBH8551328.1 hypothetical protein [Atlanticothrix silvestris CENA357]